MQYRSDLIFINPLDIRDKNGNIQLSFPDPTTSADNYISVLNGYSGTTGQYKGVGFSSNGGGSNIDMYFAPKGDGIARIYSSSGTPYRELIATEANAIATVDYVERAITIGVVYLQPVVAVFDNDASAVPSGASVTIDGNLITSGDRVLVKASNDTYDTWIIEYDGSAWTKVEDFIEESEDGTVHYRVGATVFVDNDGTTPTYKDVRFTWNGEDWVLQWNTEGAIYTANTGIRLAGTNDTIIQMAIDSLSVDPIINSTAKFAVYDNSGHYYVTLSDILAEQSSYSFDIVADDLATYEITDGQDLRTLGHSDNWVDTVYSYSAGVHTVTFKYGLTGDNNRVIMTNASGLPIEKAGTAGDILRPAHSGGTWDSGTVGDFLLSTKLPLGKTGSVGAIALYTPEATAHYVALQAPSTAVNQTYQLPAAYPSVDYYVLAATTSGVMSWVARTENTDQYVAADTGGTPDYLSNVLQGATDGTPISGIKVSTYGTHYTLVQQMVGDTGATTTAVGTDLLAIYDTVGDKIIKGNSTASQLSSIYLLNNYVNPNVFYNGSIAVYELINTDFSLVSNEYVASDTIDSIIGSTDYNSDWVLAIVQRKYTDVDGTKYETIQCNTRVYRDTGNDNKGTIDVAFSNQPGASDVFRVTLILDPTLLTQPS